MLLEELTDELRVVLGETYSAPALRLTPDAFKRKYGRCPVGYHTDPDTNRCATIQSLQRKGLKVTVMHGPSKATPSKSAVLPAAKAVAAAKPSAAPEAEHSRVKKVLHGVWHAVSHPFKAAYKLATDKKYRGQVKDFVVKACKKEGTQTKQMAKNIARVLKGEKLSAEEKAAIADQLADVVKVAVMGAVVGHAAAGGLAKLAATVATPVDELVGVAIDGPLRKATKKLFGREHGLLPTSFYDEGVRHAMLTLLSEDYKEGDEYKVIEKMVEAILDEMGKTDLDEKEITKALVKKGLLKKKGLIDRIIDAFKGD